MAIDKDNGNYGILCGQFIPKVIIIIIIKILIRMIMVRYHLRNIAVSSETQIQILLFVGCILIVSFFFNNQFWTLYEQNKNLCSMS